MVCKTTNNTTETLLVIVLISLTINSVSMHEEYAEKLSGHPKIPSSENDNQVAHLNLVCF